MKASIHILTLLICIFISVPIQCQSDKTLHLLGEIGGQWSMDENGYITYQKIIDTLNVDRTTLYNRALEYFVFNYGDANSVIQNKDPENGIIIGKGLYKSIHSGLAMLFVITVDTWHILKVDVKENRARITLSLIGYEETSSGGNTPDIHSSYLLPDQYPINLKGTYKNIWGEAFYKSHKKALETISAVEKALRGDGTQNNNW